MGINLKTLPTVIWLKKNNKNKFKIKINTQHSLTCYNDESIKVKEKKRKKMWWKVNIKETQT